MDAEREAYLQLVSREHLALEAALAERDALLARLGAAPLPHWRTWIGTKAAAWDRERKTHWVRRDRRPGSAPNAPKLEPTPAQSDSKP